MNCLHIESMAQNKSNPFLLTQVRQPVPSEDTLHPHHKIVTVRGDDPQKRLGGGGQILMDQLRAVLIEDTDVHGACM